jgi:hypothetical protein
MIDFDSLKEALKVAESLALWGASVHDWVWLSLKLGHMHGAQRQRPKR